MIIPVVWLSLHETTPCRGYWDQTMLEDAFKQRLGSTAPYAFKHYEIGPGDLDQMPIADGAVFVIGARSHGDRVTAINHLIAMYRWCVVILTGDEENVFPVHELAGAVVMQQTPLLVDGKQHGDGWWIGDGYTPETRFVLGSDEAKAVYDSKPWDWFFAGQDTHARRHECIKAMITVENGSVVPTAGFTQGMKPRAYHMGLAAAKIAPCPSGPVSVDTFRLFEALEAGCVPLADGRSPLHSQFMYWDSVFASTAPFPVIDDWRLAPTMIKHLLRDWPACGNRCFAWWQWYKRAFVGGLIDAIEEAMGGVGEMVIERAVTVIIPTSPIPSHPSTEIIEATIASVRERLPLADIFVCFDGVRPEQEHLRENYERYQRELLWQMNHKMENVWPLRYDEHLHQALMTRWTMTAVETPLVLFVEHDTPLVGEIPFTALSELLIEGHANLVRFYHEAAIHPEHEHLMVDEMPRLIRGVPLTGTMQWSQRPHLARTDFYKAMLDEYFGEKSRTMIEDVMHGVLDHDWRHHEIDGWARWQTFIYTPYGDTKRSTHIDGRESEPKFEMVYEYDGRDVPAGAPYPTSKRVDA